MLLCDSVCVRIFDISIFGTSTFVFGSVQAIFCILLHIYNSTCPVHQAFFLHIYEVSMCLSVHVVCVTMNKKDRILNYRILNRYFEYLFDRFLRRSGESNPNRTPECSLQLFQYSFGGSNLFDRWIRWTSTPRHFKTQRLRSGSQITSVLVGRS